MSCQSYSPSGKLIKSWGPAQTAAATTCPTAAAPTPVADTAYDDLDRLIRVTENLTAGEGGNRVTETVYNANDSVQSVKRAVGSALAQTYAAYTYTANGLPATVKDAKGNLTTYQYDGLDRKLKTLYPDKVTAGVSSATDYEQVAYDANGNPTSVKKRNGQSIAFVYDNLNRLTARTYTGQQYLGPLNLYYYKARFYSPTLGRFMQTDPIGYADDLNLYAYVGNNSINRFDPTGLATMVIFNGPTSGNPFGHIAIATTGSGVYSPGNNANATNRNYSGESTTAYLADQAKRRDTVMFILPTTPDQESKIIGYMKDQTTKSGYFPDNCAGRVEAALSTGGVKLSDPYLFGASPIPFPASLLRGLGALEEKGGASSQVILQDGKVPSSVGSFDKPSVGGFKKK